MLKHPEGETDVSLENRWARALDMLGKNLPLTEPENTATPGSDKLDSTEEGPSDE
ncbi:MAG: hypothetical protein HC848_05300 [Limnobacter sp.]|nr:hypothetical protein [Limnobacter sp.]